MLLCNLADKRQIKKLIDTIHEQHPDGVNVLVNNAGVLGPIDFDKVPLPPGYLPCPGLVLYKPVTARTHSALSFLYDALALWLLPQST